MTRIQRTVIVPTLMIWMILPALAAAETDAPGNLLPEPEGLLPQVEFWQRIFSEYGSGQVVVHHIDHPSLIYEVVELPGERMDSYTEEQEEFVEDLLESWEERLESLERSIRLGEELSGADSALSLLIVEKIGSGGIDGCHEKVRTQRGLKERFRRGIELGNRYESHFRAIFREEGLPEDLAYLPHVESSYQSAARSSAGAVGTWQFTRSTGRRFLRIDYAVDQRLDPVLSARAAARYLAAAHEKLGDWALALTSYNYGVNGMLRAKERFGGDIVRIVREHDGRYFGFASRNFYSEFLAARKIASDPERFFPGELSLEPPLEMEETVLKHRTSPAGIARRYGVALKTLAELNPSWSIRTLHGGLAVPRGVTVWLPPGTLQRYASGKVPPADLSLPDLPQQPFHRVQPGETLSGIALQYGLSLKSLRRLNGMNPGDSLIFAGERLIVGRSSDRFRGEDGALIHVVSRGENPTLIAQGYGISVRELLAANRLHVRSVIYPGQKLRIPSP